MERQNFVLNLNQTMTCQNEVLTELIRREKAKRTETEKNAT
jgi:hypothetical protein